MNKPWKLVLVLVGIFLAGAVTGAFVTLRLGHDWIGRRPGPEQWAPNHLKKLVDRLGLQPAQQEQLRPIIQRNAEELNRVRGESMAATKAVFERMEREVSSVLTPEQIVKYEQLNKEMRERAKKVMPDHGKGPPGPGGPPPREPGKPGLDSPPPLPPEKPAGGG